MEYISSSRENEEFVPRKCKEEFFCDGKVIEELYHWTDGLICNEKNIPFHDYTLNIFNHAYHICWMIIGEIAPMDKIKKSLLFEDEMVRKYSCAVAYAILRMHENFYPVEDNIYKELAEILPKGFYAECYSNFMQVQSAKNPLEFSILFRFSPHEPTYELVDFERAKHQILDTIDEAIRLQKENEELHNKLYASYIKSNHFKNEIIELQKQNALLQQKVETFENDTFYKAVNINSIFEYAQSKKCSENNREAIRNTLLYLCSNKVSDEVIEKIKNLELGGKVYIGKQENHGCQQFYGNVTDSDFHA